MGVTMGDLYPYCSVSAILWGLEGPITDTAHRSPLTDRSWQSSSASTGPGASAVGTLEMSELSATRSEKQVTGALLVTSALLLVTKSH